MDFLQLNSKLWFQISGQSIEQTAKQLYQNSFQAFPHLQILNATLLQKFLLHISFRRRYGPVCSHMTTTSSVGEFSTQIGESWPVEKVPIQPHLPTFLPSHLVRAKPNRSTSS